MSDRADLLTILPIVRARETSVLSAGWLIDALLEGEAKAGKLLEEEGIDPIAFELPHVGFELSDGRTIAAVRLERDPAATRFTLVLLTKEDL